NAGEVGTRVGDVPCASGSLEGVDGAISVQAALRKHGERHWVAMRVDGTATARDPIEIFAPGGDGAGPSRVALHQSDIQFVAFEIAAELDDQIAADVEPESRTRAGKFR